MGTARVTAASGPLTSIGKEVQVSDALYKEIAEALAEHFQIILYPTAHVIDAERTWRTALDRIIWPIVAAHLHKGER